MKPPRKIIVNAPSKRYAIYCGEGALKELSKGIRALGKSSKIVFLSSPKAWKYARKSVALSTEFGGPLAIIFDDHEAAKNLATVERISRQLVRAGADRNAVLVAEIGRAHVLTPVT